MIGVFGSFIANSEKRGKEAWPGKGRNGACRAVGHCRADASACRACENVVITCGGLATGTIILRFKLWVYCAATRGTYGVRVTAVRHGCLCPWNSVPPSLYGIKISSVNPTLRDLAANILRGTYGVKVTAVRHGCLCPWSSVPPSLYGIKISSVNPTLRDLAANILVSS